MKLGRNDPCHCGSGKKYKKCHLDSDAERTRAAGDVVTPELVAEVEETMRRSSAGLRERGVLINYVAPVSWQGRKVFSIGTRVYMDRPPEQTFSEFLITVLRQTLGVEWWEKQDALPANDRHFIKTCYDGYQAWREANSNPENEERPQVWAAPPSGWTQALLLLAWDVASLIHAADLPEPLLTRLKDPVQYQGARYEIAVAAILARLDCEIEFLDSSAALRSAKHAEFIATYRPTGARVVVEAKSRHRQGVIHFPGDYDEEAAVRGDVRRLFERALTKAPSDSPFLIFIDVNAPLTPQEGFEKQWRKDVKEWMDEFHVPTEDDPDIYSALCLTNFAPHYQEDDIAPGSEWTYIQPLHTLFAPDSSLAEMLLRALDNYDRVPEIAPGGDILD